MLVGEVDLEPEELPHRHRQGDHHGDAREDGARDEVGGEDGGVPAGHDAHGEVPRHHRVHREHQWRSQRGQEDVGLAEVVPFPVGAAPSQRNDAVELLAQPAGLIARRGQVRNRPQVEEDGGHGEVGRHRKDVPHQWGLEVGPEEARVGVGDEPVRVPDAAHVDEREEAGGHDREHRHRLREPVDRLPPGRAEEEEDGGDERARVGNADPEHEGGDVGAPADGGVQSRQADAVDDLVRPRAGEHRQPQRSQPEQDPPAAPGTPQNLEDVFVDLLVGPDIRVGYRAAGCFRRCRHPSPGRVSAGQRAGRRPASSVRPPPARGTSPSADR